MDIGQRAEHLRPLRKIHELCHHRLLTLPEKYLGDQCTMEKWQKVSCGPGGHLIQPLILRSESKGSEDFSLSHMVLGRRGKFRSGVGVMRRWDILRKHSLSETSTIIVVHSTTGKANPVLIKGNCLN